MSFLGFVLCAVFTVDFLENYHERGQRKHILRKFELNLGKIVRSTFDKKE